MDNLRNFTAGFEACCISALFPIPSMMFIFSVYNFIHILVSSQLHNIMFVNSIPILAAMYVHDRSSFRELKECMACFQSLNIHNCCFFHGLVVDSVLLCCDLALKTNAEI